MLQLPVFVAKINSQVGNGLYPMLACFPTLGVHVSYTFESVSNSQTLLVAQPAVACDGSCKHFTGSLEDFAEKRHDSSYQVAPIVKQALLFSGQGANDGTPS